MDPPVQGGPPGGRTAGGGEGSRRQRAPRRRWLREDWGLELRWLPVEDERLGGSARSRGGGWKHWRDGKGSTCDVWHRSVAMAELIGDEEEGFPPSIAGRGGFGGTA